MQTADFLTFWIHQYEPLKINTFQMYNDNVIRVIVSHNSLISLGSQFIFKFLHFP